MAFFIGREVGRIARPVHRAKVEAFASAAGRDGWSSRIGSGGGVCADPTEVAERRLIAFRSGFESSE